MAMKQIYIERDIINFLKMKNRSRTIIFFYFSTTFMHMHLYPILSCYDIKYNNNTLLNIFDIKMHFKMRFAEYCY